MACNYDLPSTMRVSTNENNPGRRYFGYAFESVRNVFWIYIMFLYLIFVLLV